MAEKSSLRGEAKMHPPQASGKRREIDPLEVKCVCNIKHLIRGGARSDSNHRFLSPYCLNRGQNAEFERPRRGRGPLAKLGDECRNVGVGHGRMRPRASLARFGNSLGTFDRNAPASGLIGQHWAESDRWRNGRNGRIARLRGSPREGPKSVPGADIRLRARNCLHCAARRRSAQRRPTETEPSPMIFSKFPTCPCRCRDVGPHRTHGVRGGPIAKGNAVVDA